VRGWCVYHRYNQEPIQIGRLQRHAMDHFYANGAPLLRRQASEHDEKIACIGGGPASLACAAELRQRGYSVTIFEGRSLPGGLNTHGIAEYKLRPTDSLREVEMIRSLGVEFRLGTKIDNTSVVELEKEYAVAFIGVGLGAMQRLKIPGANHPGVINALTFIEGYKTKSELSVGRRVVVVGAGNTAIDAARAALRLGAEQVHLLYRRGEQQMSAFSFEYEQAKQEGVHFFWWTQPVAIHSSTPAARIEAIECRRMQSDALGALTEMSGSEFRINCDMVIPAIGQSSLLEFLKAFRGIQLDEGRVHVNRATGQTSNPRYFAGGDCVNGGREVVDAVADGKRAALGIAQALETAHA